MKDEKDALESFLRERQKKRSRKRDIVLEYFLKAESHVSAEDLYHIVHARHPEVGRSTVYRALKVFCESGVARPIDLQDGRMRYEHDFRHPHHDHLICTVCGNAFEFICQEIEALQDRVAQAVGFAPESHSLQIYGRCKVCRGNSKRHRSTSPPPTAKRPIAVRLGR